MHDLSVLAPGNERGSGKPDFRSKRDLDLDLDAPAPSNERGSDKPPEKRTPLVRTPAADKVFELFGEPSREKFSIAPLEDDDDDADGDFAYRGFDSGNWQDSRFPADPYSRPDGGKPGDRPDRR